MANKFNKSGTRITFKLNDDFFSECDQIIPQDIIDRLKYTVYMVEGMSIDVYDETRPEEEGGGHYHFVNDGGIEGMLSNITTGDAVVTTDENEYSKEGILSVRATARYKRNATVVEDGKVVAKEMNMTAPVEVAIRFNDSEDTDIRSFANTIQTFDGGVHENALKNALVATFGKLASKNQ